MDKITLMRFVNNGETGIEGEVGGSINESINLATNLAVQAAVVETIKEGARKGHWNYKEPAKETTPAPEAKKEAGEPKK
jgi:hypothetical protein